MKSEMDPSVIGHPLDDAEAYKYETIVAPEIVVPSPEVPLIPFREEDDILLPDRLHTLFRVTGRLASNKVVRLVKTAASTVYNWSTDTRLGQEITARPSVVLAQSIAYRTSDIIKTGWEEDLKTSEHPMLTASLGATALTTQVLDRAHLSLIGVPKVATEVLKHTQNAWLTGGAGAATFLGWYAVVGESFVQGLNAFPNAVNKASEVFPGFVDTFTEAVPGVKKYDSEGQPLEQEESQDGKLARLRKSVGIHVKRGLFGFSQGNSSHIGVSYVRSKGNMKETRQAGAAVTAEGTAVVGAFIGGVAEGIILFSRWGWRTAARVTEQVASNTLFLYGVAFALMGSEYHANQKKKDQAIDAAKELEQSTVHSVDVAEA